MGATPSKVKMKAAIGKVIDDDKTTLRADLEQMDRGERREFKTHLEITLRVAELLDEIDHLQTNTAQDI